MATYAYTQEYYGDAGDGTIKFNVTAAKSPIEPLTRVTITGQVSGGTKALKSIGVYFMSNSDNADWLMAAYKNVTIAKSATATFTMAFDFPYEVWQEWYNYQSTTHVYYNELHVHPCFVVGTGTLSNSQLYDVVWMTRVLQGLVSGFSTTDDSGTRDMLTVNLRRPDIPRNLSTAVTDEASVSALTTLGYIVTINSLPRVAGSWEYSDLSGAGYLGRSAHVVLTLTGAMTGTYAKDTGSGVVSATFDLPSPTQAGTVDWVYTVTDMFGNTASATGSFDVAAYSPPSIVACSFERYQEVETDTGYAHEASPSGEYIWLNLDANIAAVNSRNAWTATLTAWRKERTEITPTAGSAVYENTTGERRTVSAWALAGSDGQRVQLTRDEANLSNEMVLSAAFDWSLRLTITDALGNSVTLLVDDDIRKDSAVLDVGPYGVSVGARSTALEANPQFECSYPAHFYSGIETDKYHAGDTFATSDLTPIPGLVTSSTSQIYLTIPVDKSLERISAIRVTRLVGGVRGISGYVNGSSDSYNWLTTSGMTIVAYRRSKYLVVVRITKSSALTNVNNNTPVVMLANVTLAFS